MHPPRQIREAVEEAVVDQRSQEHFWRVGDPEEVLRSDVLATSQVVGNRHGVVVKGGIEEPPSTADMQHERHVGFTEHIPEPVQVRMGGRPCTGRRGWHHHGRTSGLDRFDGQADGATRVDQRYERHREQALVLCAEVGHGLVLRRAARIETVLVLASEPRRGEGGEHQLAVDAEEIQHPAPLHRIEGAHSVPTLVVHEALLGQFRHIGVRTPPLGLGNRIGQHGGKLVARRIAQPILELRVDEVVQEIGQLHHMAVSVEDAALPHVGRRLHRVHQPFHSVTLCH